MKQILTFRQYLIIIKMSITCQLHHYLSKREDECAQTMKQVFKESLETSGGSSEHMKSVAHADTSKRECPLQEAVYQVVREFLASKSLPRRAIRKQ